MVDRVNGQVNIQVGPIEMLGPRTMDIQNCFYGCSLEPRKILERQEVFVVVDQQPEAVLGDVSNVKLRSVRSISFSRSLTSAKTRFTSCSLSP